MFCPTCGKGEQKADSYCRNCGEFLVDSSSRASLVVRILGIGNPERQLNLTLAVDLVTAIVSGSLLFSLMGYFDATEDRTGVPTTPLVYVLYVFLGLVCIWQLFSFTIGTTFKRKLSASRRAHLESSQQPALNPADEQDVVPITITENTTRRLEKIKRVE
jgi:hypothetical protein